MFWRIRLGAWNVLLVGWIFSWKKNHPWKNSVGLDTSLKYDIYTPTDHHDRYVILLPLKNTFVKHHFYRYCTPLSTHLIDTLFHPIQSTLQSGILEHAVYFNTLQGQSECFSRKDFATCNTNFRDFVVPNQKNIRWPARGRRNIQGKSNPKTHWNFSEIFVGDVPLDGHLNWLGSLWNIWLRCSPFGLRDLWKDERSGMPMKDVFCGVGRGVFRCSFKKWRNGCRKNKWFLYKVGPLPDITWVITRLWPFFGHF